jgi:hypothetical protein
VLVGLLTLLGFFQWFCGFYVVPPGEGARGGQTVIVWRIGEAPFFNSPATAPGRAGPAGRILARGLPYWAWAYRQSLPPAAVDGGRRVVTPPAAETPRPAERQAPDDAEREQRLERIRREIERIREEARREATRAPPASGASR